MDRGRPCKLVRIPEECQEHLVGKAAVRCAHVGRGRVLLYGADVTYRGQPLGTFTLKGPGTSHGYADRRRTGRLRTAR